MNSVSETIELKFIGFCRLCLMESEGMISILEKNDDSSRIISMISSVGNFEVVINNDLPGHVCQECVNKLRVTYDFQRMIKKSNEFIYQRKLKMNLNPITTIVEEDLLKQTKLETMTKKVQSLNEVKVEEVNFLESSNKNKKSYPRNNILKQIPLEIVKQALDKLKTNTNLTCIKCNFEVSNRIALQNHVRYVHKELIDHWCSKCNLEVEDLTTHIASHKDYECEFCNRTFTNKNHFIDHLRAHTADRPHKCTLCSKGFLSPSHLKVHLRSHTKEKPYKCDECNKAFSQGMSLKIHLKKEHNIIKTSLRQMDKCDLCNKNVINLEKHNKKCHDEGEGALQVRDKKQICTICGKAFRTTGKLNVHMRIHTGKTPYECSYCGKKAKTRGQLTVHERIHTGEKPHVCSYCGLAFRQSTVLLTHIRIHTGRPVICHICSKQFCREAQLKVHLRSHSGEKPYICLICGRGFVQKSHLTDHHRTHSNERPFKCDQCTKTFKQSSALKYHMQIHLGYKPFKCSQCPYACRQSYSLTVHMGQHQEDLPKSENPHRCDICQKGFNTSARLKSHNSVVHGLQS